jgi:large subunit ribosomal protein L3
VTTQSLRVVIADPERGVLMIKGAVPGSEGGWVLIKDAVKRKAPEGLPFPAALRGDGSEAETPVPAEEPAPEAAPESAGEPAP